MSQIDAVVKQEIEEMVKARILAKNTKYQGGFSLPSVIIGSIIAAVLGGVALTSMWGSVDKASISAEVSTIAEAKTAVAGILEDNKGFPLTGLDNTFDAIAKSRLAQMPKEFQYELVLVDADGTGANTDQTLALKATALGSEGANRLKAVAADLDLRYDSVAGLTVGKFVYNITCSAPATVATSATDCYYITPLQKRGAAGDLLATATVYGGVAADTLNKAIDAAKSSPLNY
ncbi:MAG: hypothetical protein JXK16_02925 [Thiotrichales bacterium]|nr:hypothetical protein [Thiotrichales bacterium]